MVNKMVHKKVHKNVDKKVSSNSILSKSNGEQEDKQQVQQHDKW